MGRAVELQVWANVTKGSPSGERLPSVDLEGSDGYRGSSRLRERLRRTEIALSPVVCRMKFDSEAGRQPSTCQAKCRISRTVVAPRATCLRGNYCLCHDNAAATCLRSAVSTIAKYASTRMIICRRTSTSKAGASVSSSRSKRWSRERGT